MRSLLKLIATFLNFDLLVPIVLFVAYIVFLGFARGYIPTGDEIISLFTSVYKNYGYQIIFLAAFLEALILVNLLTPGMVGMMLGVVFAKSGELDLTLVILSAAVGASLGYMIDYVLGYFGFANIIKRFGGENFIQTGTRQLRRLGKRGLILSFIHPGFGSFFSFSAGITKYETAKFILIAILSTIFWMILWSIQIYILGDVMIQLFRKYAYLFILFVLLGFVLVRIWKKDEK